METPPPQYDSIASPTTGLADYFTRLSDAYTAEGEGGVGDEVEEEEDGATTPRARGSMVLQEVQTTNDSEVLTTAAPHAPVGNWI
jgi:arrestin-related trafficking adapter 3/6